MTGRSFGPAEEVTIVRSRATLLRLSPIELAVCVVGVLTSTLPVLGQSDRVARVAGGAEGNWRVYEGVGLEELRLGDSAERIEHLLGEAEGGSEWSRRYRQLGLHIQLYEGKVYGMQFDDQFQGSLLTSGLGIGDTLADLEWAYGPILKVREVADHNAWNLDRILLVRRGGPQVERGDASKIAYYDLGMYFFLDEHERIMRFGLSKYTGYALRPANERFRQEAAHAGIPAATRDERVARWKASRIRNWDTRVGVGFAVLEFGDPTNYVESLLGPPDSGSEAVWNYRELGIKLVFRGGRVSAFFFFEGRPRGVFFTGSFPGRLVNSGIGIGDRLEDVEAFYGAVLERRPVAFTSEMLPSRVLGVCQGCTAYSTQESSRIRYTDIGLYFDFDERERIVGFGLNRARAPVKAED